MPTERVGLGKRGGTMGQAEVPSQLADPHL